MAQLPPAMMMSEHEALGAGLSGPPGGNLLRRSVAGNGTGDFAGSLPGVAVVGPPIQQSVQVNVVTGKAMRTPVQRTSLLMN